MTVADLQCNLFFDLHTRALYTSYTVLGFLSLRMPFGPTTHRLLRNRNNCVAFGLSFFGFFFIFVKNPNIPTDDGFTTARSFSRQARTFSRPQINYFRSSSCDLRLTVFLGETIDDGDNRVH